MEGNAEEGRGHLRSEGNADEREPEVKPSPILERKAEVILLEEFKMEGEVDLINVESKTLNELKGELDEEYKTIAEKEAEIHRLLEKREGVKDDGEPEVEILERKFEDIIPKECWALVFQNLNGEDLLSCRQVCTTFRQLLDFKEFKGQWKFKLIIPLLLPYLKANIPVRRPWENFFNARLTCNSWHNWIDKYVSEVNGIEGFRSDELALLMKFSTSEDIEEFQDKFGECDGNPFPSGFVCIYNAVEELAVEEEDRNAQKRAHYVYIEKIYNFLERFGTHILRLYLCFRLFGSDDLNMYKLIKRVTIHLPNLKELVIRNDPAYIEEIKDMEQVASYIAENPLGPSPKLQTLYIGPGLEKMEEYLLDAFGPQLTHLKTPFSKNIPSRFQTQQFENLRKLWLGIYEPRDTFELLRFLQAPLELLILTCRFGSAPEPWNLDKVLRNLKHLPIELLQIQFCGLNKVNLAEADIHVEEYNTSIKTLILYIDQTDSVDGHQISFNFLQALTKLENFKFFSGEQVRTTHPGLVEAVKLNEYLFGGKGSDLPYHSNVWEKVPSLKTLTLGFSQEMENEFVVNSICTREKYERIIAEGSLERN